jgi:putative peptide zinc metalloprotease protein
MATLADSLVSSSARKMPIRKRPDLTAQKQYYLGKMCWVVKDPVGLHYFRFQEEEYAILEMLDGQTSLDEIKERFEEEFPPQKITLEELHQFLGMLHRSGLILSGVPGQGQELLKRRWQRRKQQALAVLSNILCIRMRGIDPERFLDWLYGKTSWFFSRTAFACCILLMLAALSLIIVEFNVFRSKLPEFHQFFNLHNALWLTVTLAVSKILHEFGHGLTCKHFGGECHEMGLMILVLTPCLYCNVSDSWMLPNKWHRAAIGAAGMYVEGILAAICTFVWWYTSPGLINNLCLNIMFISSVSTVIFNGNPLLRYDGYYILADVMEIPNLRQKATQILSRKMSDWFLGIEQPDDPFLPQRNQVFFAA